MSTTASIGYPTVSPFTPRARPPVEATEAAKPVLPADKHPKPVQPQGAGTGKQARNQLLNGSNILTAQESKSAEDPSGLSEAEQKEVAALKKRDAEVRAHEQAHATAGGQYAGAAQLQYETGPDGAQYAVSGHVSIDVSPVQGDPKETIQKMQVVKRAANAPAEPSAQDRSVAAKADEAIHNAREELSRQQSAERESEIGAAADDDDDAGTQDARNGASNAGQGAQSPLLNILA